MHIGLVTDSLAGLPLNALLDTAGALGISALEFGCGNWSTAPHLNLDALLADSGARRTLLAKLGPRSVVKSGTHQQQCDQRTAHEPG